MQLTEKYLKYNFKKKVNFFILNVETNQLTKKFKCYQILTSKNVKSFKRIINKNSF